MTAVKSCVEINIKKCCSYWHHYEIVNVEGKKDKNAFFYFLRISKKVKENKFLLLPPNNEAKENNVQAKRKIIIYKVTNNENCLQDVISAQDFTWTQSYGVFCVVGWMIMVKKKRKLEKFTFCQAQWEYKKII